MNKNTRRNLKANKDLGFKVDRGEPINSSKLRAKAGKKPWWGMTSKGRPRPVVEEED